MSLAPPLPPLVLAAPDDLLLELATPPIRKCNRDKQAQTDKPESFVTIHRGERFDVELNTSLWRN